jgi:hypothetical protein
MGETAMTDERWDTGRLWNELKRFFPSDLVRWYQTTAQTGFDEARRRLTRDIAEASRRRNEEDIHERLVLAHMVLAIIAGSRRGVLLWEPLPDVAAQPWKDKEGPLLMWAGKYGSSASGASATGQIAADRS